MQYLGGKSRIARRVVNAIIGETGTDKRWVEPFVGGSWVLKEAGKHFSELRANDLVKDLQLLYEAVGEGWEPPTSMTKEGYNQLKEGPPSPLRAFVGFGTSFQGKWFGGYAWDRLNGKRTYRDITWDNLRMGRDVYQRTEFSTGDYSQIEIEPGDVVYCDPPYEGTTEYGAARGFDHEAFWGWTREVSARGVPVYVSEYKKEVPVDTRVVWSRTAKQTMKFTGENPEKTEYLLRVV